MYLWLQTNFCPSNSWFVAYVCHCLPFKVEIGIGKSLVTCILQQLRQSQMMFPTEKKCRGCLHQEMSRSTQQLQPQFCPTWGTDLLGKLFVAVVDPCLRIRWTEDFSRKPRWFLSQVLSHHAYFTIGRIPRRSPPKLGNLEYNKNNLFRISKANPFMYVGQGMSSPLFS